LNKQLYFSIFLFLIFYFFKKLFWIFNK